MFRGPLAVCLLQFVVAHPYRQTIDSGPGIDAFFHSRITVPFTSTDLSPPPKVGRLAVSAFGDIHAVDTVHV